MEQPRQKRGTQKPRAKPPPSDPTAAYAPHPNLLQADFSLDNFFSIARITLLIVAILVGFAKSLHPILRGFGGETMPLVFVCVRASFGKRPIA